MLVPARRGYDFFDEMFKSAFKGFPSAVSEVGPCKIMKTDIKEYKDSFSIIMDLPGFDKDNIKAELKEGYLSVTATKNSEVEDKDDEGKFIKRERFGGTYKRSFYVGDHLSEEEIKASYKDGVLELSIPKEPEPVPEEPKYISID